MERRDKKARLDSLTELKKLRTEGGNRLDSLATAEDDTTLAQQCSDDDEFVEHDERGKRSALFSFKPKSATMTGKAVKINTASLQSDDYFQSLISKMDEEELSEDDEGAAKGSKVVVGVPPPAPLSRVISREPSISSLNLIDTPPSPPPNTRVNACNVDYSEIPNFLTAPPQLATDPILSSEYAPAEGEFEIDEAIFANTDWLNDLEQQQQETTNPMDIDRAEISVTAGNISPLSNVDGVVNFYWIDAYEKPNGTVYLFGKIASSTTAYVSCCVIVNNLKRNLFFLPRETVPTADGGEQEVTLKDVHEEIAQVAATNRISKFGCKKVERKYAFEIPDMPVEADYIKMVYPFSSPALSATSGGGLKGRTFSHVFGVSTTALELFLVKRRIMGPCWLQFRPSRVASARTVSWCKVEMEVDDPKAVTPHLNGPAAPPLTVLSLALRTIIEPISKTHELVAASGLVYNTIAIDGSVGSVDKPKCSAVFSVARETENLNGFTSKFIADTSKLYHSSNNKSGGGKVELAKNERALLSYLIAMIHQSDPDVIVGHNFLGFDLGVLLHRMRACKVDFWSRLGRLNWSQWPKAKPGSTEASYAERQIVSGRLICDTYLAAKDLVRSRNYSLQTLVETQLQQQREEFDYERVREYFATPATLVHLLRHCEGDAYWGMMLMTQLMILPLTKQLTSIAGNLWSRTLIGGRAERNEFLLLHEFHRLKYICPDKNPYTFVNNAEEHLDGETAELSAPMRGGRRKATYAGGLVLEPKKGLYSNIVLLLDFNSLYPSIIQEFNICFTTVERDGSTDAAADTDAMPAVPDPSVPQGVLPKILANLVARRREVKKLMKDPKLVAGEHAQLHIRQQALKLTANSMYGCLGFAHSRFHARPLAMLITGKGREILQSTVDLAQGQCKLEVVYGDTDSVMVHTGTRDLSEAKRMGQILRKAVNERYRLLEIELDGIFCKLLLLKKKKYAAVILEERPDGSVKKRIESKGLDLVRRDWCALSVDTSNVVLEKILAEDDLQQSNADVADEIHTFLRTITTEVQNDSIPLDKYIISKNLTKEPEQYADAKSQPHVMVALKMKEKGAAVRAGDTIPYIICSCLVMNGSTFSVKGGSLAEHAFHPDDVRKDHLMVDKEWYLAQQVHPCVARLCEHLPGTDSGRIAACLGLDASKYQNTRAIDGVGGDDGTKQLGIFTSDEERFKNCKPVELYCASCDASVIYSGGANISCVCGKAITPLSILYQLRVTAHRLVDEYYAGWMECDETSCRARSRQLRVYEGRCPNEACRGTMHPLVTGQQLYHQLLYYRSLVEQPQKETRAVPHEYEAIGQWISQLISKCSYPIINLAGIFSFVTLNHRSATAVIH